MQAGGKWRKPAQWNPSLSKSKILPQYQISLTAQFCPAGILLGLPPQARLLRLAPLEKIHPRKEVHSHEKIQHAPPPPGNQDTLDRGRIRRVFRAEPPLCESARSSKGFFTYDTRKLYPNQININKLKENQLMGVSGEPPAPYGKY